MQKQLFQPSRTFVHINRGYSNLNQPIANPAQKRLNLSPEHIRQRQTLHPITIQIKVHITRTVQRSKSNKVDHGPSESTYGTDQVPE
jgi:hypothetical protein